jgi:cell wall-associated NlpC family hydrolase
MAVNAGVSGKAIALATAGGVLVYAGLRGESPLAALRGVLTGSPPPLPEGKTVTLPAGSSIGATGSAEGTGVGPFPGLASAAERYLGRPYKWAGTFVGNGGGDCSGLVVRAFADNGITGIPRTSLGQMSWSKVRKVSDPGRGDLVWWPGHIGIMVSSTRMINAPHTGTVVRYASVGARQGRAPTYLRYVGNRVNPSTPRLRRGR